ncbi:MAG: hypothetical protein AB7F76_14055, partial [Parvibaculaceae bacterium]
CDTKPASRCCPDDKPKKCKGNFTSRAHPSTVIAAPTALFSPHRSAILDTVALTAELCERAAQAVPNPVVN